MKQFITAGVIVVVFVGIFFYRQNVVTQELHLKNIEQTQTALDTIEGKTIAREVLAAHNTQDDCWVSYQGEVYDVSAFLPKHPGSAAAIIPYCGKAEKFEAAFTGQHAERNVPVLKSEGTFMGILSDNE